MWCIVVIVNDQSHRLRRPNVPDISCFVVSTVDPKECPTKNRIVEVGSERVIAKVENHVRSIILHSDVHAFGQTWVAGFERECRHGLREWIVATESRTRVCSRACVGSGGGQRLKVGILVVNCSECLCEQAVVDRASDNVGSQPELVAGFSRAVDDDICSLAYSQGYHAGVVRDDRHEIVGNDLHSVSVDGDFLHGIGTSVH